MYSLDTFLKPLNNTETTVQIRTKDLVVKHTISPYTVKRVVVSNNLIRISLNSQKDIILDFSTKNEAVKAGVLLESALETLRVRKPIFVDKIVKEYVSDAIANGPQGFQGPTGSISTLTSFATSSDPSTTTSTTGVMMGFSQTITPVQSGKLLVLVCGDVDNNTNARGSLIQIRYGTGTPPTNGSALTGTPLGGLVCFFQNNSAIIAPFNLSGIISGLSIGVTVWIDISLASVTGGTSRVRDVSFSIIEL